MSSDGKLWTRWHKPYHSAPKTKWILTDVWREVDLRNEGKYLRAYLMNRRALFHTLMLETFHGPCPDGMEARHLNGDNFDNRISNLKWGTRLENEQDKHAHNVSNRGERHHRANLYDDEARDIIARGASGESEKKTWHVNTT